MPRDSNSTESQKRVFLVDDHPLVRERLGELIAREPDLVVCGEAEDVPQALAAIVETRPDVVVLDISLKQGSGLELLKDLQAQRPDLPVLVLSMHDESLYALRALRAGALGYITKLEPSKAVLTAMRQVLDGRVYLSEPMQQRLARLQVGRETPSSDPLHDLSDRELEVFSLLGDGFATRRIAEDLHISIKSVEVYRARIKEKLGLADGTELLFHAMHRKHFS
jgi:DNA-binding NarL/FixJ family response regulator